MKGETKARSLKCTNKMWEPLIYSLFFAHSKRGSRDDIRKSIRYMDYLIARLLCLEKIELDRRVVILSTPNEALDNFIIPILNQQLPSNVDTIVTQIFSDLRFKKLIITMKVLNPCQSVCLELANVANVNEFDKFCSNMYCKFGNENYESVGEYIELYLQTRSDDNDSVEHIETSLREFRKHLELRLGKMSSLHINRFQLMSRLAQTCLVDSVSRAIDYRLRLYILDQKDLLRISNEEEKEALDGNGVTSPFTTLILVRTVLHAIHVINFMPADVTTRAFKLRNCYSIESEAGLWKNILLYIFQVFSLDVRNTYNCCTLQ